MDWSEIIGHHRQRNWFNAAISQRRLASTFLFVGPEGCGKRRFSLALAKSLLCLARREGSVEACRRCESCVQFDAGTNPDLLLVEKPRERAALPMELLVGSPENRLRDGVCYQLRVKPFHGLRRIAIIDDADTIQEEAANSMLKTLEEPPPGTLIFLIATNEQRQLPTIRSRCQIVRFQGLAFDEIAGLLMQRGVDRSRANEIASNARGSMSVATSMLDEDLRQLGDEVRSALSHSSIPFLQLAKSWVGMLQGFGDESQVKRERLRQLFDFAIQYFRVRIDDVCSSTISDSALSRGDTSKSTTLSLDQAMKALVVSLQAQAEIERMVTPATLIESWLTDLTEICEHSPSVRML